MKKNRLKEKVCIIKVCLKAVHYIFRNYLMNNNHNCPGDIILVFTGGTQQSFIGIDDDIQPNTDHEQAITAGMWVREVKGKVVLKVSPRKRIDQGLLLSSYLNRQQTRR